jgi:hypothetical protein
MERPRAGGSRARDRMTRLPAGAVVLLLVLGAAVQAGAYDDSVPDPVHVADPYYDWNWDFTFSPAEQRFPFLDDWTPMSYSVGYWATTTRPRPEGDNSPFADWEPYPEPRVGEPYRIAMLAQNNGYEPKVVRFHLRLPEGTVPAGGDEHRMRCVDAGPWDHHKLREWADHWRPLAGSACPSHPVPSGDGYDLGTYTVPARPFIRETYDPLRWDYGTSLAVIVSVVASIPHISPRPRPRPGRSSRSRATTTPP